MHRRPPQQHQRRVRWTQFEIGLLSAAFLLMAIAVGVEGYSWLNPPVAPAAPRAQEQASATASATGVPSPSTVTVQASATGVPSETSTSVESPTPPPASVTVEAATALPTALAATALPATALPTALAATALPATATTTPTATIVPTWTPLPTFELTDPPLTVDVSASTRTVRAGDQFSYFLTVASSSDQPRQIELRQSVDGRLDILEASSNSGACTIGYPIVCTVAAAKAASAQIIINLRVPVALVPGSVFVSQALARDDQRVTAASERIEVSVIGVSTQSNQVSPTVPPTRPPAAPVANDPAPATAPAATEAALTETPAVVAAGLTIIPTATHTATPATDNTSTPTGLPQQPTAGTVRSPTIGAAQSPTSALPPTLAPLGPSGSQPTNPTAPSVSLPRTAATVPAFGLGVGLLGLALTLHSTRRIRRADAHLSNAGVAIGQLGPLVDQASELQQATAEEINRMNGNSLEMQELLERIKPK